MLSSLFQQQPKAELPQISSPMLGAGSSISPDRVNLFSSYFNPAGGTANQMNDPRFADQYSQGLWGPGGEVGMDTRRTYGDNTYYDKTNDLMYMSGGGKMGDGVAYSAYRPLKGGTKYDYNGTPYSTYDSNGGYLGEKTFTGIGDHFGDFLDSAVPMALLGGMGALALPNIMATLGGGMGGLSGSAGTSTLLGDAGLDALGSAATDFTMGGTGGATAFTPATAAEMTGMGVGSNGFFSSILPKLQNFGINKGISSLASTVLGGGGGGSSNGGSNNGGSGMSLNDIFGIGGGLLDASRQGQAAQGMQNYLNNNLAQINSLYSPGSPEYTQLWDQMSRKDAAAGRNSQYGPRSVNFAAQIAKDKADNLTRFTTGTSKAYADALNQNAAKYAGLSSALGRTGAGGGLDAMLRNLLTGGKTSFGDIGINPGSSALQLGGNIDPELQSYINGGNGNVGDWGSVPDWMSGPSSMPTEDDVMSFLDGWY